jgi:outer membrane protein TolC
MINRVLHKEFTMKTSVCESWKYYFLLLVFIIPAILLAQDEVRKLTLEDAIEIAKKQSPDALMAKHKFRASYWQYKSFRASYLPSLLLRGEIPAYNKSINKIRTTEGDVFSLSNNNNLSAGLSLNQKIGPTGGDISLNSDLNWLNNIAEDTTSFNVTFINVTYRQPLFKYNSYKWDRTIEPMLYEEARKMFIENMEQVSLTATNHFFNLLLAQISEKIALINEANYDTLYKIAQGRYNLGKIAENDLLQLELQFLRAGSNVQDIALDVENQLFQFKSFLRIKETTKIELIAPDVIIPFTVVAERAINEARHSNSKSLSFGRQLIEAESELAKAKYDNRFDAELFAVYGVSNFAHYFEDLNTKPQDQQILELGISLPILDWGVARGKIKMAESNQEIVRTTVEQEQIDFDQEVFLKVARFNMQYNQVMIAAKADTVARKGYDITKARYLIGKISITDLNIAQTEADNSKSNYINALGIYWRNYYDLRRLTLYDFEKDLPIMVDYKDLL